MNTAGWLTVTQAAAELGVALSTVRKYLNERRLRGVLIENEQGEFWLIPPAQVQALKADMPKRGRPRKYE